MVASNEQEWLRRLRLRIVRTTNSHRIHKSRCLTTHYLDDRRDPVPHMAFMDNVHRSPVIPKFYLLPFFRQMKSLPSTWLSYRSRALILLPL